MAKNDQENWQEFIFRRGLSVRTTNVLLKNFSSCDEFLAHNENSFGSLKNCGQKTVIELIEFRNSIIAQMGEVYKSTSELQCYPKPAEETLKQPPSERNIPFLPIFSSQPLVDFAVNDLHLGFHGTARLQDFVFSIRTSKILKRLGLETIGEVMLVPSGQLLSQKNFGRKCLKEVQNIISSFVLSGDFTQTTTLQEGNVIQPDIDYSSYKNLIASFVCHCLKNKRNQAIVCARLNFTHLMPTLEQLGKRFDLTRERVRQILKKANPLLRVKVHRVLLSDFWELVAKMVHEGGGITSTQELAENLRKEYDWPVLPNPLALAELLALAEEEAFIVTREAVSVPSCPCLTCEVPKKFLPTLDFETNESYHLLVVGGKLACHCQSRCRATSKQKFHKAFIEKMVAASGGVYRLHGDLIFTQERWLVRHGDTLEYMIIYVLEKHGKPMHFSEIAAVIRKENIRSQEITDHSVQSAMSRYDSIEITSRGTYGLKKWGLGGYRSVSTAIEELLDAHGLPMRWSEIIKQLDDEFSKQNISAALHNWKNRFVSIGAGFYDRTEKWRQCSMSGLIKLLPDPLGNLARFIAVNNKCSYKLVLAFVFIRGMGEDGGYYLPTLKERFYNFYLNRHRKGKLIEAEDVLMRRIGELDASEIKSIATKEPQEKFLSSNFWCLKSSRLYLQEELVALLSDSAIHNLLLITILKGIDDYFAAISSQPPSHSSTNAMTDKQARERYRGIEDIEKEPMNESDETASTISIKKKSRGKIGL